MSHVDEGGLHAYLDGALPGGADARREVEDHLHVCADCRALLDAARTDRAGAGEILDSLRPGSIETPPFSELLERRSPGTPTPGRRLGIRGPFPRANALAWAATILIAIGSGWVARGLLMGSATEGRLQGEVASAPEAEDQGQQEVQRGFSPDAASSVAAPAVASAPNAESVPGDETVSGAPVENGIVAEAVVAQATVAQPMPAEVADLDAPATSSPAVQDAAGPRARVALDAVGVRSTTGGRIDAAPRRADGADLIGFSDDQDSAEELELEMLLSTREENAGRIGEWTETSPAEAARRLGRIPFQLDGLPWERMEIAELAGDVLIRTVHPVEGRGQVQLVQSRLGSDDTNRLAGEEIRQQALERDASQVPSLDIEREGIALMLRGLENREALESLLSLLR